MARFLLKDVDSFAGFAHAINTYLAGVALAHSHGMLLVHSPFRAAHGLEYAFDDLLAADPRSEVPPVRTPVLLARGHEQLVGGEAVRLVYLDRRATQARIANALHKAPQLSFSWVRKGRFALLDTQPCNCSLGPEIRYAGLWLRERFWRSVRAAQAHFLGLADGVVAGRHARGGRSRLASAAAEAGRLASSVGHRTGVVKGGDELMRSISISAHMRRGDVTYFDLKGRPSSRWVETQTVVDELEAVAAVVGMELRAPAVQVHIHSESKGWRRNDTEAIRRVAPDAEIHLDSSPASTIEAMIRMASSDVLLLGASGFSTWAGIFSCGVKLGPRGSVPLPMRHVGYANTLPTRAGRVLPLAGAELRRVWREYWACKTDEACAPTLCLPSRIESEHWNRSALAKEMLADVDGVQWDPPRWADVRNGRALAAAIGAAGCAARAADPSALGDLWRACKSVGLRQERGVSSNHSLMACARSSWQRSLSAFMHARYSPKSVAPPVSSATSSVA